MFYSPDTFGPGNSRRMCGLSDTLAAECPVGSLLLVRRRSDDRARGDVLPRVQTPVQPGLEVES